MKILNWMHRKFHLNNNNYSQVPQKTDAYGGDEVETASPKKALEKDTEALLMHDVLNGILTIGTLGHNQVFLAQTYCTAKQEEEEEQEEEPAEEGVKEEVVMMQEAEKEATGHVTAGVLRPLPVIELSSIKLPTGSIKRAAAVTVVVPETEEILELPLLMEDKEKLEQRTTLADLFAAEAINESAIAVQGDKMSRANYIRIICSGQQDGAADPKKLMMKQRKKTKGEQKASTAAVSVTTKTFQKLMTRMLKKKIHPEMAPAAAAKDQDVTKERSHADQKPRYGPASRAN